MRYIDQNDNPVNGFEESCVERQLFVFDIEKEDYFLKHFFVWDMVHTEFFTVDIGGGIFKIPSGTYLLCGCVGGSQDWILIDEIIGRPIDVFVLGKGFRGWSLCPVVLQAHESSACYIPMAKHPLPISDVTGKKVVLTSQIDVYSKTKDMDFDAYFVG